MDTRINNGTQENFSIQAAMHDKRIWAEHQGVGGLMAGTAPRAPGLRAIADGLGERANIMHGLVSDLEALSYSLLADRSIKSATKSSGEPAQVESSPATVEDRLNSASVSFSNLEGRMRALFNRLNEGI